MLPEHRRRSASARVSSPAVFSHTGRWPKGTEVIHETMERLCDRRLRRRIDQQLRQLVAKS